MELPCETWGGGVLLTDRWKRVVSVDPGFTRLTGYAAKDIVGQPLEDLRSLLSDQGNGLHLHTVPLSGLAPAGGSEGDEQYAVLVQQSNIRQALDEQVRHLAYHDPLTNLPNRMCLHKCMGAMLKESQSKGFLSAVLFLDLDRFKSINDTLGHAAGDQLLKEAAARIHACMRKKDRVARVGGDEFICVISDLRDQSEAADIAKRIVSRMSEPMELSGQEMYVTASIGISLYPYHGDDMETLIANADTAMYCAKREKRSGYQIYAYEMNAMSFEKLLLEQSMRKAISQDELRLYYQPQLDVRTGRLIGLEALVRWQHPELGLIPPAEFIPIAEETGLIIPLGYWTLKEACTQNRRWQDDGHTPVKISVNMSVKQLQHPDFIGQVSGILEETQLSSEWLELEITETLFIQDVQMALDRLNQLKAMGIRIALDDFGTGYSSLNYLRQFPLDVVKIDRSFIRNIDRSTEDQTIANAVIRLAHDLGKDVIVEGVETNEQLDYIRKPQCSAAQGFLFSAPLPADQMLSWLSRRGSMEMAAAQSEHEQQKVTRP